MALADSSSGESGNSLPEFLSFPSFGKPHNIYDLCPVCMKSRKYFYCSECIRNGDVTHSRDKYYERFADKKLRAYTIKQRKERLLQKYQTVLSDRIKVETLKQGICYHTHRNAILKECIRKSCEEVAKTSKMIEYSKLDKVDCSNRTPKLAAKISNMQIDVDRLQNTITNKKVELEELNRLLKRDRKKNVQLLVRDIFPIAETVKYSYEALQCSKLEEAEAATYNGCHWQFSPHVEPEVHYYVVEPSLPSCGNYSAYTEWTSKLHDNPDSKGIKKRDLYQRHLAYGIGAALTFTTQFVMVLSNLMDVHVPKRLCYSEFCVNELKKQQFLHRVAKLNANIIHLCLSQNVDISLLRPKHTIHNLLLLLDPNICDVGRSGPLEIDLKWMDSVEEELMKNLSTEEDDDSISEGGVEAGWVHVDETLDFECCNVSHYGTLVDPAQRTTSLTGDLMSSMASMWRAATGMK